MRNGASCFYSIFLFSKMVCDLLFYYEVLVHSIRLFVKVRVGLLKFKHFLQLNRCAISQLNVNLHTFRTRVRIINYHLLLVCEKSFTS